MKVFLQNAWSPAYAGREWPRASWLLALARSRSGRRLRLMIDDPRCCHNTTPVVGAKPNSVCKPDEAHIRVILAGDWGDRERIVVACGRQAEKALIAIWDGPLLAVPHPASRLLTNDLYKQAREILAKGFTERLALRQRRGEVSREILLAQNR